MSDSIRPINFSGLKGKLYSTEGLPEGSFLIGYAPRRNSTEREYLAGPLQRIVIELLIQNITRCLPPMFDMSPIQVLRLDKQDNSAEGVADAAVAHVIAEYSLYNGEFEIVADIFTSHDLEEVEIKGKIFRYYDEC